jgi:hypothetical protein
LTFSSSSTKVPEIPIRAESRAQWRIEEGPVSSFAVEPGARVLWCLRRRASDVRCVLYATGVPVEVHIVQDRDLVLKEIFPAESFATAWADEYNQRLQQHGWRPRPEDCSPSSAA